LLTTIDTIGLVRMIT